jgi:hypothetical protein
LPAGQRRPRAKAREELGNDMPTETKGESLFCNAEMVFKSQEIAVLQLAAT